MAELLDALDREEEARMQEEHREFVARRKSEVERLERLRAEASGALPDDSEDVPRVGGVQAGLRVLQRVLGLSGGSGGVLAAGGDGSGSGSDSGSDSGSGSDSDSGSDSEDDAAGAPSAGGEVDLGYDAKGSALYAAADAIVRRRFSSS